MYLFVYVFDIFFGDALSCQKDSSFFKGTISQGIWFRRVLSIDLLTLMQTGQAALLTDIPLWLLCFFWCRILLVEVLKSNPLLLDHAEYRFWLIQQHRLYGYSKYFMILAFLCQEFLPFVVTIFLPYHQLRTLFFMQGVNVWKLIIIIFENCSCSARTSQICVQLSQSVSRYSD